MKPSLKTLSIVVAATASIGVLGLPQVGAANQAHIAKAITLRCKTPLKGFTVNGTCTGTFGKIRTTGQLTKDYKHARVTMHLSHGTITMKYAVKGAGSTWSGHWKWVKGTGRYKRIRGSGKAIGDFHGNAKYTGSARW